MHKQWRKIKQVKGTVSADGVCVVGVGGCYLSKVLRKGFTH